MSTFIFMPRKEVTDDFMASDVPENEHPAYSAVTTYATGNTVIHEHRVYESKQDANTGNTPAPGGTAWWIDAGPTNLYAAFDLLNSTQTQQAESFEYTFTSADIITGVYLFNLDASSVQVIMTDLAVGGDGEVYNETRDLQDNTNITDWDLYFFEPITQTRKAAFPDLPFYYNAEIKVIVNNPGAVAKAGSIVIGRQYNLGVTLQGVVEGIEKLSVITRDPISGDVNIVPRDYPEDISYPISLNSPEIPRVKRILTDNRDTPAVFAGSLAAVDTIVLGLYDGWRITRQNALLSSCSIDVKGIAN